MGETAGGRLRRGRDRLLGGVCSGLAAAWQLDPLVLRVAAVVLLFVAPIAPLVVLLYVVLWVSMPPPDGWEGSGPSLDTRVRLAVDEMERDVRSWFRPAGTPPPGRPDPSPAGSPSAGAPSSPPPATNPGPGGRGSWPWGWGSGYGKSSAGLWVGGFLILLGLFFLGQNLGLFNGFRWDVFWPIVIIALGLLVLVRRFR